jgi:hypothetical protein
MAEEVVFQSRRDNTFLFSMLLLQNELRLTNWSSGYEG